MAVVLHELIHHVGRIAMREGLAHRSDCELLRLFEADRDSAAFEVLVRRHGPMVLGVCQRVLVRRGDADDAFQATFLALIQHSRSIRPAGSLGGWLYRVARRISVRASRLRTAQTRHERLGARPESVTANDVERSDSLARIDREIERLPKCYREAFILCHLDGQAQDVAARQLGCPLGTLQSRLARAKERLRARLRPLNLVVPALTSCVVSPQLVQATGKAAARLMEGPSVSTVSAAIALSQEVSNPMFLIKTHCLALVLMVATTIGMGTVLVNHPLASATAAAPNDPPNKATSPVGSGSGAPSNSPPAEPTIEELKRENERLRKEVTSLKTRVEELAVEAALLRGDDVPTDAEILRALQQHKIVAKEPCEVYRDDIIIVKNRLVDKLDPVRFFPLVGNAQLRHRHWECTVYYTEIIGQSTANARAERKQRSHVIYIDKDILVNSAGQPIKSGNTTIPSRTASEERK